MIFQLPVNGPQVISVVVIGFLLSFMVAFGVGSNDVANFFGTIYGTKTLRLIHIFIIAAIFELSGAMLLGYKVSDTIRKGMIDLKVMENAYENSTKCLRPFQSNLDNGMIKPDHLSCAAIISMESSLAALGGSGIWLLIATSFGMPVSTTHSIVSSTLGAGLVSIEGKGLNFGVVGEIVASWLVSPILSGFISSILFISLWYFVLKHPNSYVRFMKISPVFYFITIFINVFSVIFQGPSYIKFDLVPWWGVLIISLILGAVVALLYWFLITPIIRKRVNSSYTEYTRLTEKAEQKPSFQEYFLSKQIQKSFAGDLVEAESSNNVEIVQPSIGEPIVEDGKDVIKEEQLPKSKFLRYFLTHRVCQDQRTVVPFLYLQIIMACFGAFVHGGNDISNSISPLINIWVIFKEGSLTSKALPPPWLLFYGSCGIIFGLVIFGKRVINTIGVNISTLSPPSSFCIEFGSALSVLIATKIGLPVSTTHCQIGSVFFTGVLESGYRKLNFKLLLGIVFAWVVTIPVAGAISATLFSIIRELMVL